ncbi:MULTISPECIES: diacylglycerol kinase catalytic domain-containing protein [Holospora]|uniref:Putative inorganic polyphosphate/ATP-NAD kinase n=2 Tax=Holospora TaxID=44747 RepID=A0A061JH47_9PROT|nr:MULTISPECIES: NAD(+)/NADH kinase [Holospora]ETZ04592.1 putative inorganic polyphosphate/ATP-NAD kinase [Holospora undulata HU1]GAJ46406.1 putative inorganic polyphosphate/ATP-NAD kinase [Holospora elegans E1]
MNNTYHTKNELLDYSQRIHFFARSDLSVSLERYIKRWGQCPVERCKVIVVLGGDGFMLMALNKYWELEKPFYGLKFGSVGNLMNFEADIERLEMSLQKSISFSYFPLFVKILGEKSPILSFFAFNDVCLYRRQYQALKIKISIDNVIVTSMVMGDGLLCSSVMGKSAYYASAGGISFDLPYTLGVCAINPFSLTRWKGRLLFPYQTVRAEILNSETRPFVFGWDGQDKVLEPQYKTIEVCTYEKKTITLLKTENLKYGILC